MANFLGLKVNAHGALGDEVNQLSLMAVADFAVSLGVVGQLR
ncbi:MAG: hypothetical protein QNK66_08510 [Porticoccaceae bacterium]|jgi:hypothetical protein|tara:strand:- start:655 stop:780 length:126 start_codon:yes stop_codon:yes gene_type:complete